MCLWPGGSGGYIYTIGKVNQRGAVAINNSMHLDFSMESKSLFLCHGYYNNSICAATIDDPNMIYFY